MPANHCKPHTPEAKAKMSAARKGKPNFAKRRETVMRDGVEHYRCGRCGNFFPIAGFYKNNRTVLGIKSECKTCHCAMSIASRDADKHRDANREYARRARATDPMKFRKRESSRVRPKTLQREARAKLNLAVKRGDLFRPEVCSRCGRSDMRIEGHHHDYNDPLNVTWLCSECHGKEHRHAHQA